jgi:hypothetical protein
MQDTENSLDGSLNEKHTCLAASPKLFSPSTVYTLAIFPILSPITASKSGWRSRAKYGLPCITAINYQRGKYFLEGQEKYGLKFDWPKQGHMSYS